MLLHQPSQHQSIRPLEGVLGFCNEVTTKDAYVEIKELNP